MINKELFRKFTLSPFISTRTHSVKVQNFGNSPIIIYKSDNCDPVKFSVYAIYYAYIRLYSDRVLGASTRNAVKLFSCNAHIFHIYRICVYAMWISHLVLDVSKIHVNLWMINVLAIVLASIRSVPSILSAFASSFIRKVGLWWVSSRKCIHPKNEEKWASKTYTQRKRDRRRWGGWGVVVFQHLLYCQLENYSRRADSLREYKKAICYHCFCLRKSAPLNKKCHLIVWNCAKPFHVVDTIEYRSKTTHNMCTQYECGNIKKSKQFESTVWDRNWITGLLCCSTRKHEIFPFPFHLDLESCSLALLGMENDNDNNRPTIRWYIEFLRWHIFCKQNIIRFNLEMCSG